MTGRQLVVVRRLRIDNWKNNRAPRWVNFWRPGWALPWQVMHWWRENP